MIERNDDRQGGYVPLPSKGIENERMGESTKGPLMNLRAGVLKVIVEVKQCA